jgi:hypothetical protein
MFKFEVDGVEAKDQKITSLPSARAVVNPAIPDPEIVISIFVDLSSRIF